MYNVNFDACNVQFAMCNMQPLVCSVQCAVYTKQCTVRSVQCAGSSTATAALAAVRCQRAVGAPVVVHCRLQSQYCFDTIAELQI